MMKTDFPVRAHSESEEGYKAFTKDKRTRTTRNSGDAVFSSNRTVGERENYGEKRHSYNPNFTRDNRLTERNRQQGGYRSERSFGSGERNFQREERNFNREGGYQRREGGFQRREREVGSEGFQPRERSFNREERNFNREGSFNRERNFQREGSYQQRSERSFNREERNFNREGGYQRRERDFNREGFQPHERTFNREERSFNRDGGYQRREEGRTYGERKASARFAKSARVRCLSRLT